MTMMTFALINVFDNPYATELTGELDLLAQANQANVVYLRAIWNVECTVVHDPRYRYVLNWVSAETLFAVLLGVDVVLAQTNCRYFRAEKNDKITRVYFSVNI